MKKFYLMLSALLMFGLTQQGLAQSDLIITGVVDGDLTGGKPKIVEFYVVNDIPDLSVYGFGSANNGGGTDGVEYVFPADAYTAGDFIYLTTNSDGDDVAFEDFFGFAPTYQSGAAAINGDDAVELFLNDVLVDVYGEQDVNGDGTPWDYTDSWAYRQNGTGPSTTFNVGEWVVPGLGTLDGETSNETAANPFPLGTYDPEGGGTAGEVTIQEIQETTDPDGDSPLVDQEVTTFGIVTAAYDEGFWIQDGTGPWSGIFVREDNSGVAEGDSVTVTGTVQENFGLTRINNVSDITINNSGNDLPAPEVLTTGTAGVEEFESVLIQLLGVTCTDDDLGFGEWQINDGSGDYVVDDELYDAGPQLLTGYDLTGIAYFSFGVFKMLPRDADDVVLNENADQLGLGFEAVAINADETDGTITIEVNIFNPVIVETTVEVAVIGGTAENGVHYNFLDPTTLIFTAGDDTPQSFEVEIIDDMDENADRDVIFALQNPNNTSVLIPEELTLTIQDDDAGIMLTDIAVAAEEDADGVAVNNGVEFTVAGLVYGVNMNGSGTSFTLIDQTGGVGVYSNSVIDDYVVTQGDSIVLTGTINQFNGLTQMAPSGIDLISQGNEIAEPLVVTSIDGSTESQLVKLECVFLVDPGEWTGTGSGFNVTVSNGTDEFQVRIDNDVDLYSQPAPAGTFDVTGIGGQFDPNFPLTEGYQLLPRYSDDIVPADCGIVTAPVNDNCLAAIDVTDLLDGPIGEPQTSTVYSNAGATVAEDEVETGFECFGEPDGTGSAPSLENNVWFTFTGDGNTYFLETTDCNGTAENYIPDGDTQIAIYQGLCGLFQQPYLCNEDGPNASPGNFEAGLEVPTEPGVNYIVMVDGFAGAVGDFCLSFTRLPSENDECDGAVDISGLTGGELNVPQTSGAFTNVGATSENDPNPNDEVANCWFGTPLQSNTVWFTFEGDGSEYFIETVNCGEVNDYIDDGDTQMAIFTGSCDDLVQVACNEDGPQATSEEFPAGITLLTTEGETYSVMIDGYEGADGEFCMQMTMTSALSTENAEVFELNAYPNPTNGWVSIESPVSLENVSLFNVIGQRVKAWNDISAERFEFNTNDLESGVYLLQATSGNRMTTLRLIVE